MFPIAEHIYDDHNIYHHKYDDRHKSRHVRYPPKELSKCSLMVQTRRAVKIDFRIEVQFRLEGATFEHK